MDRGNLIIKGSAAFRCPRVRVLEDFIVYAQRHSGVVFMKKDETARFAHASPLTIREDGIG